MNTILRRLSSSCAALLLAGALSNAQAATYTIDPGAAWSGYMNVFELPANGGAYLWGSGWGTADLRASFSGPVLSLSPNTIGDPNPYWYIGGGGPGAAGNKIMEANFYQEFNGGLLGGQTVTFTGNVLLNSLTSAHTAIAFIKDFAPDYSSAVTTTIALTPGVFSFSLNTINDPARHVQFGFTMKGVNVWATDVAPYGQVDIVATAVPEPATGALLMGGIVGLIAIRRNKTRTQI
ncbi:MAG: PEP-CTERM sorting domain-containing protein [Verrucomicrobiota bacterium]